MRTGIALGSNLGDRLAHLHAALKALRCVSGLDAPVQLSKIYETEPVGSDCDAGAYLNAVVEVEYSGQPMALLDQLQAIEASFGRPSKRPRNAPRIIDLDILYVGNLILSTPEVIIPHPRLHLRRFVLTPLNDIRPDLILPGQQQNVGSLLAALQDPAAVVLHPASWAV